MIGFIVLCVCLYCAAFGSIIVDFKYLFLATGVELLVETIVFALSSILPAYAKLQMNKVKSKRNIKDLLKDTQCKL